MKPVKPKSKRARAIYSTIDPREDVPDKPVKMAVRSDGNKVMTVDPDYWILQGMLEPVQKSLQVQQASPLQPKQVQPKLVLDIAPTTWDLNQYVLNRGIEVSPRKSPFSLSLSLPKLEDLLALNTPLRLAQEYFADVLGLSDLQPLMPSLFPRLKNGKLPKYADGDEPNGWYNSLNPFYQWVAKQYNIGSQDALDKFTGNSSYPYALESVYNIARNYKPDYTILDIYLEANVDLDIYDAMLKFGYHTKSFADIKPEEWLKIDSLYRVGEDAWKKDNPYKSYSSRERYANGKSPIRIKPANRGKLTRLKKRTGKSESELYKTGGPAVRKMITFARNARKWKH